MSDFIFRLPIDNQLTDTQRIALEYDTSIVVSGGPGSGKTVVTIYKFLTPIKNRKDAILFTYNKTLLASIRGLLLAKSEDLFGDLDKLSIDSIIESNVASFSKFYGDIVYDEGDLVEEKFEDKINSRFGKKYSEIFFDEAQDLTPAIFENAFILAEKVSCGADDAQNLQGNFLQDEAVDVILDSLNNQKETYLQQLEANFRNTKEIFEFARAFVPNDDSVQSINVDDLPRGENPEIFNGLSDSLQLQKILEIIRNNPINNIGIIVNYGNQVTLIKNYLEENGYSCKSDSVDNLSFSYYFNGMNQSDEIEMFNKLKTPFIVTYDSCKGLEFDIVIMPFFNDAENALSKARKLRIKDENDKCIYARNADGTIKKWATINHYYVGATRARTQLFVLCNIRPAILDFFYEKLSSQTNTDLPF